MSPRPHRPHDALVEARLERRARREQLIVEAARVERPRQRHLAVQDVQRREHGGRRDARAARRADGQVERPVGVRDVQRRDGRQRALVWTGEVVRARGEAEGVGAVGDREVVHLVVHYHACDDKWVSEVVVWE